MHSEIMAYLAYSYLVGREKKRLVRDLVLVLVVLSCVHPPVGLILT